MRISDWSSDVCSSDLKHALDARIGGPDFGIVEIEAQEDELVVVLAAFIPGRDAVAPKLVEHRAVAFRAKRSGNTGEQLVALGHAVRHRRAACRQLSVARGDTTHAVNGKMVSGRLDHGCLHTIH